MREDERRYQGVSIALRRASVTQRPAEARVTDLPTPRSKHLIKPVDRPLDQDYRDSKNFHSSQHYFCTTKINWGAPKT